MSEEFIDRDGLHLVEYRDGTKRQLNLAVLMDGELTGQAVACSRRDVSDPPTHGKYSQTKMLMEAVTRYLDAGATEGELLYDVKKVIAAWNNLDNAQYVPGEPWYLWGMPTGQAVYRNDVTKEVLIVAKQKWNERLPLSDFVDLMEAQGDEQIHTAGPSIPFTP